jgi:hypothetical protein
MKLVRFHPEAEQELAEHEAWYRRRSEVAAQGFLLEHGSIPSKRCDMNDQRQAPRIRPAMTKETRL